MDSFQVIVLLISAAILLLGVAQKIGVPYPIALVLSGTVIGFIPGGNQFYFNPNLILEIVLPPILYYGAFWISHHEFKKNWREIVSLALGLVFVTTVFTAIIFKWLFPDYSWALAFVFGAIISPPDAISAVTILKRFALNPRLLTILEGESLINDAFALVFYKLAVSTLLTGIFSWKLGGTEFIQIVFGGIFVGVVTGFAIQIFSSRYLTPIIGVIFSFAIPYIIYFFAEWLNVSGVLAVVINGLILSRVFIRHPTSLRRVLSVIIWHVFIIVLNCFVFILIGLQLRSIVSSFTNEQLLIYTAYGFIITLTIILLRLIWVYLTYSVAYFKTKRPDMPSSYIDHVFKEGSILGWSGMRGIISLTIVLALPYTIADGSPLPGRNVIIFITFIIILLTLLIPGLTLAKLIKMLNNDFIPNDEIEHKCRKKLLIAAEETIAEFQEITEKERSFLLNYFQARHYLLKILTFNQEQVSRIEQMRRKVFEVQRRLLLKIWREGEIEDKVLKILELELDVEESLLIKLIRAEIEV